MLIVISIGLTTVLSIVVCIHVYWAFGGKWAIDSAIPSKNGEPLFKPGFGGTLFVALMLIVISTALLIQIRIFSIAQIEKGYVTYFLMAIGIVFIVRAIGDFRYVGVFKKVTDSSFAYWDSRLFSPAFLMMGILIGLVGCFG
ncbi:MAG: DUF3995 domain-containing protein [Fibrobacterales bacterium]